MKIFLNLVKTPFILTVGFIGIILGGIVGLIEIFKN